MKVEIFSSPQCNYCEQAKQLLQRKGIAFETLDIAADEKHREEFMRYFEAERRPGPVGPYEFRDRFGDPSELDAALQKRLWQ